MDAKYLVKDIRTALTDKLFPTVVLWNRLEGRPRMVDFNRALRAEVRDALWMLTKQWQMGEFRGDDAGSPILAKLHMNTTQLTRYQPDGHPAQPLDMSAPLEAQVEHRPIEFSRGGRAFHLDLRLQMGRQWFKLLGTLGLSPADFATARQAYIDQYPISLPPQDPQGDYLYSHKEAWAAFAAAARRCMDGAELYFYLTEDVSHHASDGIAGLPAGTDALGDELVSWFRSLYYQPQNPQDDAWKPSYLEYQFAVSAPQGDDQKVLTAEEYYHGRLEWYSFDIDNQQKVLPLEEPPAEDEVQQPHTSTFFPAQVSFEGMPNTRWWAFEDSRTSFGDVRPSTTDLARLLLIEFGLIYANDWFVVPFRLPVASLAQVGGLLVTNTFGERFWIQAAGRGPDDDWQRWNMFTLAIKGAARQADLSLLLPPALAKVQESEPEEEVLFVRDEMANMVWAIETRVPLASGSAVAGKQAAQEILAYHRRRVEEGGAVLPDLPYVANISYLAMTTVPEHWIPFVPVHQDGSNREVQLQRSRMLRILEGDPLEPVKIEPQTGLVRQGLEAHLAYYVHEEEVPRAGAIVTRNFQRTRWWNGAVFVWAGYRKQTGRGEKYSGLAFDQIVPRQI